MYNCQSKWSLVDIVAVKGNRNYKVRSRKFKTRKGLWILPLEHFVLRFPNAVLLSRKYTCSQFCHLSSTFIWYYLEMTGVIPLMLLLHINSRCVLLFRPRKVEELLKLLFAFFFNLTSSRWTRVCLKIAESWVGRYLLDAY